MSPRHITWKVDCALVGTAMPPRDPNDDHDDDEEDLKLRFLEAEKRS